MKFKYYILAFFVLFSCSSRSQSDDSENIFRVDSIKITGNEITDPQIILKELTFSIGDSLDAETLEYNRERIYSLGIFNHVYLYPDSSYENTLVIGVEESWYIYPLPYFELKDRDWDKISYGADLLIVNFRGRNETLRGRLTFGYDPSYQLYYYNPYLFIDHDISFTANLSYSTAANRSITAEQLYGGSFSQKIFIAEVGIGKRLNLYNRVAFSAYYQYVENPVSLPGFSASGEMTDRFPGIGLGYSYDSRNLVQFPSNGIFAGLNVQLKGLGIKSVNYQVYNIDFREYRHLFNKLIAKWRFASRLTSGRLVPFYDYSFLGLGERIRGHFNDQYEGHNLYLTSLEFFYPIFKEVKLNLDFIPLLPDELLHYRCAMYVQLFGDTGGVEKKGESFGINNLHSGYGAGLTFLILPYNIMRFEYALDEYRNGELIFELGISF